jgi:protein-tyrosine phosphatase
VYKNLFLGDEAAAVDEPLLASHGITAVLNVSSQQETPPPCVTAYRHVFIRDRQQEALEPPLATSIRFLEHLAPSSASPASRFVAPAEAAPPNVLVHCAAGKSRSPAVIVAFLMVVHRFTLEEAHEAVLAARPDVAINLGFMISLGALEERLRAAGHFDV